MNLQRMVMSAVGGVIVISILLVPIHDVEQTETYFTREPLTYEETFVRVTLPPKTVALAMRVLWVLFFPFYSTQSPSLTGKGQHTIVLPKQTSA